VLAGPVLDEEMMQYCINASSFLPFIYWVSELIAAKPVKNTSVHF